MSVKILILSASPRRDHYIDDLFKKKLTALGHEVWVRPCLREGRKAVLELNPDVCVIPPIRNPYARDFAATLKAFGCGVITRHTEPSVDMDDFKRMNEKQRGDIFGRFPYVVDLELIWGPDEEILLNKRGVPFPTKHVGAFVSSIYADEDIRNGLMNREVFLQKYEFDKDKKTVLFSSPWGCIDLSPDLQTDFVNESLDDAEGRDRYIEMIKHVVGKLKSKYNFLLTLHPGVLQDEYKEAGVPIDVETPAMDLLVNSDVLIHSGSTMAIEMHLLDKPAFQFGDINTNLDGGKCISTISEVSPGCKDAAAVVKHLKNMPSKSNANKDKIKDLELGRYGSFDGLAIDRAVEEIVKVEGSFTYFWPDVTFKDYSQVSVKKTADEISHRGHCGICGKDFWLADEKFMNDLCDRAEGDKEKLSLKHGLACPHCSSRFFVKRGAQR